MAASNEGIAIDAAGRCVHALGQTPRFFMLSPDDRLVFALNEDGDTIVAFDIDETGPPGIPAHGGDMRQPGLHGVLRRSLSRRWPR